MVDGDLRDVGYSGLAFGNGVLKDDVYEVSEIPESELDPVSELIFFHCSKVVRWFHYKNS